MCDYSLHSVSSRPAKVADKLVTRRLQRSKTCAFAAVGERGARLVIDDSPPEVAVCLLPGTELAFDDVVRYARAFNLFDKGHVDHKVARFRQIDLDDPNVQHDALEFPDGRVLKVTRLAAGQTATVLQLPVATQHLAPPEAEHVARPPSTRATLNRAVRPVAASILLPNQGAATLWQAVRGATMELLPIVARAFGSLKARKPSAARADKGRLSSSAGAHSVVTPQHAAAPERKLEVKAV